METVEYAIIGGGVAGLSAAIGLSALGKEVRVFEQAPLLKGAGAGFGLAANAMQAFAYLGLREEVEQIGFYTDSYTILDQRGRTLIAPDTQKISSRYQQLNFSVHRADLHQLLLGRVADIVVLGKRLKQFEETGTAIELAFEDGERARCRYLIVADGVHSAARQQLLPNASPRYAGYTCWRATISNQSIGLLKGSETWGRNGRFGMTPLVGDRIYWYACINATPANPVYRGYTVSDLVSRFGDYHAPIPELLAATGDEDLLWNDIIDIKPLGHFAYGRILLIGDAAHATTPNMGQGACQALEDVVVLCDEVSRRTNVEEAFLRFEKRRLTRTRYITETSWWIGKSAQLAHPWLIGFRNTLLRHMPAAWAQASLRKLLNVDFMSASDRR